MLEWRRQCLEIGGFNGFGVQDDVKLAPQESVQIAGRVYDIRFVKEYPHGPNYQGTQGWNL